MSPWLGTTKRRFRCVQLRLDKNFLFSLVVKQLNIDLERITMPRLWLDQIKSNNVQVLADIPIMQLITEVESLKDVIKWNTAEAGQLRWPDAAESSAAESPGKSAYKGKQACLQHSEGEDPWTSGITCVQQFAHECKYLNPAIEGTVLAGLIERFKLFRTKLLYMEPYSCYAMHRDITMRIHIPIITNPSNFFVFKDTAPIHIPAGWSYKVNTTQFHTFINCSNRPRIHLVGTILDSK